MRQKRTHRRQCRHVPHDDHGAPRPGQRHVQPLPVAEEPDVAAPAPHARYHHHVTLPGTSVIITIIIILGEIKGILRPLGGKMGQMTYPTLHIKAKGNV